MAKRSSPRKHVRKFKSGKSTIVRPKGKVKVKSYERRKRKLGKKITTKKIGTYYALFDEYGNLRGSKVVPFKK